MYYSIFSASFPAFNVLRNLRRTKQGQNKDKKQISLSLSKKPRTARLICMIKRYYLLQGHSNLVVSFSKMLFSLF